MCRWIVLTLVLGCFASAAGADDSPGGKASPGNETEGQAAKPAKPAGPGSLSEAEEERLDRIIERFIQYDIGRTSDHKSRSELEALGPEAIPALIRGLNRAATMSHSCPVSVLHKKLRNLLVEVEDERTLRFIRDNVGAGVQRSPYNSLLRDLKLATVIRSRNLEEARRAAALKGDIPGAVDPYGVPGLRLKSPGEQSTPPNEEKKP
jgi:hypothetical protein